MAYESNVTEYPGYVRVHVTGKRTPGRSVADADRVGKTVVDYCRDRGIDNILLVLDKGVRQRE